MSAPILDDALRGGAKATAGFDYLRIGLALYVFFSHCYYMSDPADGRGLWDSAFGPVHRAVLPMFFALSGFLVAGSFARNPIDKFIALRALRIVPALAVETLACAVLLGGAFTTLPLAAYFASPEFWAYFLNIVGDIHYTLPGVFDQARINAQLWTIPYELQCYLALVALSLAGLGARRHIVATLVVFACVLMTYIAVRHDLINTGPATPRLTFALTFLAGVCVYLYRDRVALRADLFAACLATAYATLYVKNLAFLAPLPLAYITVFLGVTKLPRLALGDLSYGVYLFHSPILCMLVNLRHSQASLAYLIAAGLPLTLAFAYASWTFVEKPILDRKSSLLAGLDALKRRAPRAAAA